MPQQLIFWPMGALALLTFGILSLIPVRRFRAAAERQVTGEDFRYGESARVPGDVAIPNRSYMNLLEAPVLFYVACLMFYVTGGIDMLVLAFAWAYVALRAAHSLVHVTYNNVMHRLIPFALSNFVLMAFWILFFVKAAR